MRRTLGIATAFVLLALPVSAQQLKLEIKDGRVNLDATSVPVRQILAEWARVGTTRMVGAEKVTGAPVTLKLVDMPERQALDLILRNVAGYMAAPRPLAAAHGASVYDRVVIMATSSSPATASAPGRGNPGVGPLTGTDRRVAPRPPNMPITRSNADINPDDPPADAVMNAEDDQPDNGLPNNQPVFTFPQPQQPGNQVFVPMPPGGFGRPGQPGVQQGPVIQFQPNANGQPTIYNFVPTNGATPQPPPTGFSVVGSPTPGMIQQPVQQPPTPGAPPPKPPGE